jgi:hypothetical protein
LPVEREANVQVDFIIIGAQKSGTTSLAHHLSQHPQISFCKKKEPHYFSTTSDWKMYLSDYHSLFKPTDPGQLYGEASTSYTFIPEYQDTHSRLFSYNPNLKLIYLMRQPVDRIISHYGHNLLQGRTKKPPEIEVMKNPAYINRSRYKLQIKPYLELFGPQQISLLIFEEYIANPFEILQQAAQFLEIPAAGFTRIDSTPRNVYVPLKKYPAARFLARTIFRKLPPSLRQATQKYLFNRLATKPRFPKSFAQTLWQTLEEDICYIEELLERPLMIWRDAYA